MKAALQWRLDSRGLEGQARDNVIWGGMGGHRERSLQECRDFQGGLPGHPLTFPIEITSGGYCLIRGAVRASLRVMPTP